MIHIYLNKGDKMTILFYIIGYIVLSIAVAYFFKYNSDFFHSQAFNKKENVSFLYFYN